MGGGERCRVEHTKEGGEEENKAHRGGRGEGRAHRGGRGGAEGAHRGGRGGHTEEGGEGEGRAHRGRGREEGEGTRRREERRRVGLTEEGRGGAG